MTAELRTAVLPELERLPDETVLALLRKLQRGQLDEEQSRDVVESDCVRQPGAFKGQIWKADAFDN